MNKEDLVAALKNALERGETIEEAKLSLMNAGYNHEDIEKATKTIEKLKAKKEFVPRPKIEEQEEPEELEIPSPKSESKLKLKSKQGGEIPEPPSP